MLCKQCIHLCIYFTNKDIIVIIIDNTNISMKLSNIKLFLDDKTNPGLSLGYYTTQ